MIRRTLHNVHDVLMHVDMHREEAVREGDPDNAGEWMVAGDALRCAIELIEQADIVATRRHKVSEHEQRRERVR